MFDINFLYLMSFYSYFWTIRSYRASFYNGSMREPKLNDSNCYFLRLDESIDGSTELSTREDFSLLLSFVLS